MSRTVVQSQILYGKPQELTNIITQAIGAALGFVGLVFAMLKTVRAGYGPLGIAAVLVFGLLPIVVFIVNALQHGALPVSGACVKLAHSALSVLMLAVFVPLLLVGMPRGTRADAVWGYTLAAVLAATVIATVVLNAIDAQRFKAGALILYVLTAFLCVVRIDRVKALCGAGCFWFLMGGCAVYVLGLIFNAFRKIPFNHAFWHVCVLGGAALHFVSIYAYLL